MSIYERIRALEERRAALVSQRDALLTTATTETRDLTDTETVTATEIRSQITAVDADLTDLRAQAQADHAAAESRTQHSGIQVTREPLTYDRGNGQSYFRDLAKGHIEREAEALGRLQRHAREMDTEMPKRDARRASQAEHEMRGLGAEESPFERRTNPNRTDGQGGYFVPPVWLIDEYVALARAGRTVANSVRNLTLPSGTDSINLPKVATGTATGVQTADAASVTSTDMTDTFVNAPVRTIAGQQDVAMQLIDQSPVSFDEIVLADLLADYNQKLDVQVINGSGASGQLAGILGVSGINAITYTDASPTGPELYAPLAQSVSKVAGTRFLPPTAIFMTPARYYWLASQLDTAGRPLVVPSDNGPFNAAALQTGVSSEGPVGKVLGLPVLLDPNIPTNLGAGTNEDRILTLRTSDLYLWEGSVRTRVLTEVLSGTLQVRLQLWNYVAFMGNRYPASIAAISGTGVIAPSGF